jgi:DNA-binding GntR family transcriptional regulator
MLPGLERVSTTEQVARALREAIVEGRIPAGTQLRELRVADSLRTSRGTVREAIRLLVQEGLVDYRVNRGAFVRTPALDDCADVYEAREAIEAWAAQRVVEGDAPLDLSELEEAIRDMQRELPEPPRPTEEMIAADLRFHHELVKLAASPRLVRAHETFAAEARMLLRLQPSYPRGTYVRDHEELLDALRRRDPRAPELVAAHLRLSARLIGEQIAAQGS